MFDTQLTLVGNLLTAPTTRRTVETRQLAASFRVASTSRRYDREGQRWVDGNSLRVRVTCWRQLAEGVADSLQVGDPVIVFGRLYTRDWTDEQGTRRVLYEMDATAVGHNLARGTSTFTRNPTRASLAAIEDEEAERRIGGEDSVPEELDPATSLHADGFTEPFSESEEDDDEFGGAQELRLGRERELVPA